ncbi:hypothetical protein IAE37_005615 [Pseudomonas sp. S31]|uniref:hypothetical protein n=1 Tax=Pseudomonas sp. S31 TaxID=1564473 RepID=UPI0019119B2C|nr:hypothetical protein [Pseudomonas sp. S31]MBK5003339.1 hypothetical protein [Pseudomonas sp. S31]
MALATPPARSGRIVRPRLFWRLLFAHVVVAAAFLYLCLICLGGYLLMLAFDVEYPEAQRLHALLGGGSITLIGAWLLKVAMPRRVSPSLIEADP